MSPWESEARTALIADAIRAPSSRNTQPWMFRSFYLWSAPMVSALATLLRVERRSMPGTAESAETVASAARAA